MCGNEKMHIHVAGEHKTRSFLQNFLLWSRLSLFYPFVLKTRRVAPSFPYSPHILRCLSITSK